MADRGLSGFRVVDFTSWIAGPYATKLFADAGADVIKVEPVSGDPMRRHASRPEFLQRRPGDSAFFQYLNGGKRSVIGEPDDLKVRELIGSADILIEDFELGSEALRRLDVDALRDQYPHLVVLSLSAYGRTGPYAARPATEFTIQGECGSTAVRGLPHQEPYMAGGRITDFVAAVYAAVAAQVAATGARRSGIGEHIDFSLTEVMNISGTVFMDLIYSTLGRMDIPGPPRSVETPSIEPTKDGFVGVNTNSPKHHENFLRVIGREDWIGDAELATAFTRMLRFDEWQEAVWKWSKSVTTAEAVAQCSEQVVPVAPVHNGKTVLEHEQLVTRKVFEDSPSGDFKQPRPPYLINGERMMPARPAPTLGEHTGNIESRSIPAPAGDIGKGDLPLAGLKILDATAWWAGPIATQIFATLGADVIHVESVERFDGIRGVVMMPNGHDWWEQGPLFSAINCNKRGIAVELNTEQGLEVFKELIAQCDVIVENFSPRVFDRFGLDAETVAAINPNSVYVRMPAFGLDGPWRNNLGFAQTMEQMAGLAWITGHADDQPRIQRGVCDPIAGMHAAFAILAALEERDRTGKAQFLECTMIEGALNVAGEPIVEYTAYGNIMEREGNRSTYAAPQGLYLCVSEEPEEEWLALSIATDAQWQQLVKYLGEPDWALAPELNTLQGRRENHDAIDKQLRSFFADKQLDDVIEPLVALGVPAGSLLDARKAYLHPQLDARGMFEEVTHPSLGTHPVPGAPFKFASRGDKPWIRHRAPLLGEHNREVLKEFLGYSDEKLDALEAAGVIGTKTA